MLTQPVCSGDLSLTLTTSAATTPEVDYSNYSNGTVSIPNGSSITTLTFHMTTQLRADLDGTQRVGDTEGSRTFYAAYSGATAVTMTVAANRIYNLPATISGCAAFKMVANAGGVVNVCLKG